MKQTKNYVAFVLDQSGSMGALRTAAMNDYNTTLSAITNAATSTMQDTIVSLTTFNSRITREVVNSNPHVLKPLTHYSCSHTTKLWAAIIDTLKVLESLPDFNESHVTSLVMVTTDGEDDAGNRGYDFDELKRMISRLQRSEKLSLVFRIPRGSRSYFNGLGVPDGNIQEWDTTIQGMEVATAKTTQAVNTFYASRSAGAKSSSVFYANAAQVDTSVLVDISQEVSLYIVPNHSGVLEIRDFVLSKRQVYLKGAAFYQLTKTEPRISHKKLILIREKNTGKVYTGKDARSMIGLPTDANARLHPGDHGAYDIFIQSESTNRHLMAGTGLIYWEKVGVQFTDADVFPNQKPAVNANGAVILPTVVNTGRPTPKPARTLVPARMGAIAPPVVPALATLPEFHTRSQARGYANGKVGLMPDDRGVNFKQRGFKLRWTVKAK